MDGKPSSSSSSLTGLSFDNRNLRVLPIDPETKNYCRTVPNSIFSRVSPSPVNNPQLVAFSRSVFSLLGIDEVSDEKEVASYFSGNKLLPGSETAAHCYCGHQFGSFAGQLGDGAALYLGEIINQSTGKRWELQLKGAGKTPYSRQADGRKVLRSSIREFLCSEAMASLSIPTTRAATLVTTDSRVERDPFYDGHPVMERCSVVSRVAENFFRFGSFEIFKNDSKQEYDRTGSSSGNEALKKLFLDHLIGGYFPEIANSNSNCNTEEDKVVLYFQMIVRRTARLISLWQSVGFVHGVMNTDNMSVLGLTIDYGPFGFMEYYDENFVPNGSDSSGRYSYKEQPAIGKWNLKKFAEVLSPLLPRDRAEEELQKYDSIYREEYLSQMRKKFGFSSEEPEDEQFFGEFFSAMSRTFADFTDVFVAITEFIEEFPEKEEESRSFALDNLLEKICCRCATPPSVQGFMKRKLRIHRLTMNPGQIQQFSQLFASASSEQLQSMFGATVPLDVLKEEISQEKKKLDLLLSVGEMTKRYEKMSNEEKYSQDKQIWSTFLRGKFIERVQQDHRSSSSSSSAEERVRIMRTVNPTVVLRNWMAQHAIEQAEEIDSNPNGFQSTRVLLSLLEDPFNPSNSVFYHPAVKEMILSRRKERESGSMVPVTCPRETKEGTEEQSKKDYSATEREFFLNAPPDWADSLLCTCSS
jgi:uncharacterized protein YdiU (UPF0061 family)